VSAEQAFTLRQEAPALTTVDLGAAGASHGDMLAFEARIAAEDGTAGFLSGILITVDLPDGSGDLLEDRIGQLTFDLGGGNSLVVSGKTVYPPQGVEMNANAPQLRAVIGGTGSFIGARGQVTTARNDDGSYSHRFELVD
jgi:hypothetical protein